MACWSSSSGRLILFLAISKLRALLLFNTVTWLVIFCAPIKIQPISVPRNSWRRADTKTNFRIYIFDSNTPPCLLGWYITHLNLVTSHSLRNFSSQTICQILQNLSYFLVHLEGNPKINQHKKIKRQRVDYSENYYFIGNQPGVMRSLSYNSKKWSNLPRIYLYSKGLRSSANEAWEVWH